MIQLLLLEDDDAFFRRLESKVLQRLSHPVAIRRAQDRSQAQALVEALAPDLILSDLSVPEAPGERPDDDQGEAFLAWLETHGPGCPVLVLSGQDLVRAISLVRRRAVFDFVSKSSNWDEIHARVELALAEVTRPLPEAEATPGGPVLVGISEAMQTTRDLLSRAAETDSTLLITGETGTGKSLAARWVHARSPRAQGPFVAVNCGALPSDLIEAELFGHAKGAFTGAETSRKGKVRAAESGTLFLDEIGELSPAAQVKLLRVLEEREVEPLGTDQAVKVDVRILTATHRNLKELVQDGSFREDLLFRIQVLTIPMPPLRQRLEDLRVLVPHLLSELRPPKEDLTPEAWALLETLPLPGNLRELKHLLEAAAIRSRGSLLGAGALGASLPASPKANPAAGPSSAAEILASEGFSLRQWLKDKEQALIEEALRQSGGNRAKAADLLGEKPDTLRTRLRRNQGAS